MTHVIPLPSPRSPRSPRAAAHDIPDPPRRSPARSSIDSREVEPGACSSPSPASASTATTSPPRRRGGRGRRAGRPARRRPRDRRRRRRGRARRASPAPSSSGLRRPPSSALTGSAGKTSTKDLIAQVLTAQGGPTVAPAGSLNNEIGLPLTALRAAEDTSYLVLEMGARGIGHIRYLTRPRPAEDRPRAQRRHRPHRRVRRPRADRPGQGRAGRGAARRTGVAVLNADDPLVRAMAARTKARVVCSAGPRKPTYAPRT